MLVIEYRTRDEPDSSTFFRGVGMDWDFKKKLSPHDMNQIFVYYKHFKNAGHRNYTFSKYVIEILEYINMWRVELEAGKCAFFRYLRWFGRDHFAAFVKEYRVLDQVRGDE